MPRKPKAVQPKIIESEIKITEAVNFRTAPARTVVTYKDIKDLPYSYYLLFVEPSPMQSLLFPADVIDFEGKQVVARLKRDPDDPGTVITRFSNLIPWYLVQRDVTEMVSTEDMHRRTAQDGKLMDALHKELYPDKEKKGNGGGQYL